MGCASISHLLTLDRIHWPLPSASCNVTPARHFIKHSWCTIGRWGLHFLKQCASNPVILQPLLSQLQWKEFLLITSQQGQKWTLRRMWHTRWIPVLLGASDFFCFTSSSFVSLCLSLPQQSTPFPTQAISKNAQINRLHFLPHQRVCYPG